MSNIDYWQRRKAMNMYHYMQSAEETSKEISKVYHKASLVLSNEMDKIFERFVTKHKLSEDDARKLLTSIKDKTSLEEIKAELRKGATGSDKRELLAELESPAYAYRLNRLEDKQQQIDNLMNTVYNQEKALSTDHYKELMGESYNRSMYEIQRQAGIGYSFDKLDSKTIDNMLKSKWSGANYSSRIWNNTQKLADSLKTELMVGLLTGEREADISKNLMFQFASGANNARRLVRTESCHIANEMDMKAYKESGIDTYVFVATLDLKTSAICASLDGKRFKVKDQQPGVNAPPMHPWCRSTTICDISDEELSQMKRRSKNPVTGKSELVPANMTYEEWHKKYVEKTSDEGLAEGFLTKEKSKKIPEFLEKVIEEAKEKAGVKKNVSYVEKGYIYDKSIRIGSNNVNLECINSDEYKKKFLKISNDDELNDLIYKKSIELLRNNNNSDTEGLYILSTNKHIILNAKGKKDSLGVELNKKQSDIIKQSKSEIIGIHNHPTNLPPNGSDFATAGYRKYKYGIVVTHNGKVYMYSTGDRPFLSYLLDNRIDKYCSKAYNLSIREAYEKALNEFRKEYGISWQELE